MTQRSFIVIIGEYTPELTHVQDIIEACYRENTLYIGVRVADSDVGTTGFFHDLLCCQQHPQTG